MIVERTKIAHKDTEIMQSFAFDALFDSLDKLKGLFVIIENLISMSETTRVYTMCD